MDVGCSGTDDAEVPGTIETSTRTNVLVTACRAGFAAVLLPWFLIGGLTKIAGLGLSVGPAAGIWPLSLGAYHAFLPGIVAQGTEPSVPEHAFVLAMTLAELALPFMVVAGVFGRSAAALLMVHIWLAAAATGRLTGPGALFDAGPFDAGPDRLVLWSLVLLPVALLGAGPVSADGLIARLRRGRARPE